MPIFYYPLNPSLFALRHVKMLLWGWTGRSWQEQLCTAVIERALDDLYSGKNLKHKKSAKDFFNSDACYRYAHHAGIAEDQFKYALRWISWFTTQTTAKQLEIRQDLIDKIERECCFVPETTSGDSEMNSGI